MRTREQAKATLKTLALGLGLLAALGLQACSKGAKVYHVGVLSGLDYFAPITDGFKEKMAELGYVEGGNITYDVQKTGVDPAAYKKVVENFVAAKVDLIFVFPTEAAITAKAVAQGSGIPVLFAAVFTENTGLINSVREPGGNITGVRWPGPDMALQRLELIRELVPKARKIMVPYQKGYPIVQVQMEALRQAFITQHLTLIEMPVNNAAELDAAMEHAGKEGAPDAVMTIIDPLAISPGVCGYAAKHGIPFGGNMASDALFGSAPKSVPQGKQAAFLADKILKGVPAGSIPVVSAESHLEINYRVAKKLGLTVGEGLLSKADEVIR
ncbi:MAG: ABC transporter substrate-binding protein [Desulfobaccales bacterium]